MDLAEAGDLRLNSEIRFIIYPLPISGADKRIWLCKKIFRFELNLNFVWYSIGKCNAKKPNE